MKAKNYLNIFLSVVFMLILTNSKTQNNYYIYSNAYGGYEPWYTTTNTGAMNSAFGTEGVDWYRTYFETADPGAVFSASTCFVFLEGSDAHAIALEAFLDDNAALIESWVSGGGNLFLNAAPNEGDNIDFGFGGVHLIYPWYAGLASAADPMHAIFNGPFLPVGTEWTGSSFSHAVLNGGGTTPLIIDELTPTRVILAEKAWGSGKVLFGGMTTNNFHNPELESANLRANILRYLACAPPPCSPAVPTGLYADNITTTSAKLHWDAVPTVDKYAVFVYTAAGAFVVKKKPVSNSTNIPGLTPGTDYVFKVRSLCVDEGTMSAFSDPAFFTTLMRTDMPEGEISLLIYPNPGDGVLNISSGGFENENVTVNVINMNGAVVYKNIMAFNNGTGLLDLSNLTSGMYYVRLSCDQKNISQLVVIQ